MWDPVKEKKLRWALLKWQTPRFSLTTSIPDGDSGCSGIFISPVDATESRNVLGWEGS